MPNQGATAMSKKDEIIGFMKGKARIVGDIEHSVPTEDWNLGCDESDEPRTDGKTDLDLFRESCEAAERERNRRDRDTD